MARFKLVCRAGRKQKKHDCDTASLPHAHILPQFFTQVPVFPGKKRGAHGAPPPNVVSAMRRLLRQIGLTYSVYCAAAVSLEEKGQPPSNGPEDIYRAIAACKGKMVNTVCVDGR